MIVTLLGGIRFRPEVVPFLVGLYITAAYWFTASTSFTNPSVTIAKALTDTFSSTLAASGAFVPIDLAMAKF